MILGLQVPFSVYIKPYITIIFFVYGHTWILSAESCVRVEDGATVLDHAFITRRRIEGLQPILKDNLHLQGYLATGLKKIPVHNFKFIKTVKILDTSFCHLNLLHTDFLNWNGVKMVLWWGSFAGDAENKFLIIVFHIIIHLWFDSSTYYRAYHWSCFFMFAPVISGKKKHDFASQVLF